MTAREFEEELARAVQDLSIETVKSLPEPIKKPIRQAVGRVATNLIEPVGYSYTSFDMNKGIRDVPKLQQTMGLFAPHNIAHTISSLVQDKPAYNEDVLAGLNMPHDDSPDALYTSRRPLFREYFDLPNQDVTNAYVHSGKDYWINPNTRNQVAREAMYQFQGGGTPSGFITMPGTDYNAISGSYLPGQPDPWNFDLHPEEIADYADKRRHLPSGIYGREMLEALGRPAVLHTGGYINTPTREEMQPSGIPVTENYNPSFDTSLGPVDETLYRLWKQQYAPTDPGRDYDYRGAYQAGDLPQPPMGHWPDTFKKPNHPTFSEDSQYEGAYPEDAGKWFGDEFIPPFL